LPYGIGQRLGLPRPLSLDFLVVAGRCEADGRQCVVRGVTGVSGHVSGGDRLPGRAGGGARCWVRRCAGGAVRRERGFAGLAHAHLTAYPGARRLQGLPRPCVGRVLHLKHRQHALSAAAGPLGQQVLAARLLTSDEVVLSVNVPCRTRAVAAKDFTGREANGVGLVRRIENMVAEILA